MPSRYVLAGAFTLALAAQPLISQNAAGAGDKHPFPKPTNLKVLPKNIAPDNLKKIMHGFAGSLGVKCSFCHAENPKTHKLDFASDSKQEKESARTMMLMTREINQKYMVQIHDPDAKPQDKHVTCGTCHRGHSMPQQFVPPPEEHNGPAAGEKKSD